MVIHSQDEKGKEIVPTEDHVIPIALNQSSNKTICISALIPILLFTSYNYSL